MSLPYNDELKTHSQQLRCNMTDAERRLWSRVRLKQLNEYQFYRQKPIGNFIVDFYCPKGKLVIEIDGSQHLEPEGLVKDEDRDNVLKNLGLKVLRFSNIDVLKNVNGVIETILQNLP